MQRALEADGTQLLDVPGEAHEQVGRVEVHGHLGHFLRVVFLLVLGEKFIHFPQSGPLPQVVSSLQRDQSLNGYVLEESALVPKERIVPNVMMMEIDL